MVDLPTFKNLTDTQFAVLLETFKPFEGATQAQTRDAYLAELRFWLVARTKEHRRQLRQAAQVAEVVAENEQIESALPVVLMPTPPVSEPVP